jgi:hypothetical protein
LRFYIIVLLKVVPGSYSEACYAVVQVISMEVEFTDVKEEEEEPVPITYPVMKTEDDVSIHISQISSIAYFYFCFQSGELNLRSALKNVKEDCILFHIVCGVSLPFCFR